MSKATKSSRSLRVKVVISLTVVSAVLVAAQLVRVSALAPSRYRTLSRSEDVVSSSLPALRGSILDRNGVALAMAVTRDTITADPLQVTDPQKEAQLLAPLVGQSVPTIKAKLLVAGGYSVIARGIQLAIGAKITTQIDNDALSGIAVTPGEMNVYPEGSLAEPIVGLVSSAGRGEFGLEYQYQKLLAGKDGSISRLEASGGLPLPSSIVSYHRAHAGSSLELSIDGPLQYVAERALSARVAQTRALGGTAVVMDVATGQILAMASVIAPSLPGAKPLANGGQPVDVPRAPVTESWTNQAVSYAYEPGSVAKIATFAAALEDHLITPTSTEMVPAELDIDGSIFHDAWQHPAEIMSMQTILAESSNLGTIEIAKRLGAFRLAASFKRLGWTLPTGLSFPGETNGYMANPVDWSPTAIGSMPIGQDQLVTPLQILDSYNAIANNGVMETPRLVLDTISSTGKKTPIAVRAPHRVMPQKVDDEMRKLLSDVTGPASTAPAASIPGYVVAGKTGTSQKPWKNARGYQPGAYWGTFVGMVPAAHPVLSAIVMIDQPNDVYGGSAAAPVFSEIMRYALARYGVTPTGQVLGNLLPKSGRRELRVTHRFRQVATAPQSREVKVASHALKGAKR